MVDLTSILQVLLDNAVLFGIVFIAAGILLALAGRLLTWLVLGLGILVTLIVAAGTGSTQPGVLGVGSVVLIGFLISGLLALAVRWVSFAVAVAVFLAGWFLLLHGWLGTGFPSSPLGSALWIAATGVTALLVHAVIGLLPGAARLGMRLVPRLR